MKQAFRLVQLIGFCRKMEMERVSPKKEMVNVQQIQSMGDLLGSN